MLKIIKEHRKQYHKKILNNLDDYIYRKERYNLDFSIAIGICDTTVDMSGFNKYIRKTDCFIVLENYLCIVIFDGISIDNAIKAASNLQTKFQSENFGKQLFVGVADPNDYHNDDYGFKMVHSLFDILEHAISHNNEHEVVDYAQLFYTI